jgi:hypothetical protein
MNWPGRTIVRGTWLSRGELAVDVRHAGRALPDVKDRAQDEVADARLAGRVHDVPSLTDLGLDVALPVVGRPGLGDAEHAVGAAKGRD